MPGAMPGGSAGEAWGGATSSVGVLLDGEVAPVLWLALVAATLRSVATQEEVDGALLPRLHLW